MPQDDAVWARPDGSAVSPHSRPAARPRQRLILQPTRRSERPQQIRELLPAVGPERAGIAACGLLPEHGRFWVRTGAARPASLDASLAAGRRERADLLAS